MHDKVKDISAIERKVTSIIRLNALPDSVIRVTRILNNPSSTAADVGSEIAKDPAFSAQVLKLVNSGFYGFSNPVTSIPHATVLLGFNVMKTLVMSASMIGMIAGTIEGLWEHSMACARTSAMLARTLGADEPEELSALGLLHDIGKVVIAEYLKDEFDQIRGIVEKEDVLFIEAEKRVLGVTHAEVASWLLTKWNLPSATVMAIATHHDISEGNEYSLRAAMVHTADVLVRARGIGSGGDNKIPALDPAALRIMGVEPRNLKGFMNEMEVELYDMI